MPRGSRSSPGWCATTRRIWSRGRSSTRFASPCAPNNSATDSATVRPGADLSVTKTGGQATASPGQVRTYTIVVSNAGPNAANGATVTDTVPAALTGPASWTCAGSGGGTCGSGAGGPNISETVNLPVGGSVTYTLTGTV